MYFLLLTWRIGIDHIYMEKIEKHSKQRKCFYVETIKLTILNPLNLFCICAIGWHLNFFHNILCTNWGTHNIITSRSIVIIKNQIYKNLVKYRNIKFITDAQKLYLTAIYVTQQSTNCILFKVERMRTPF